MPEQQDRLPSSDSSSVPMSTLGAVVSRLQSQPLLFGTGVLLVLLMVVGTAADQFSQFVVPALIVFVAGLGVWLAVELPRARAAARAEVASAEPPRTGEVNVSAKGVGATGRVEGISGLPASHRLESGVRVEVENIDGTVRGVDFAKPEAAKDEHGGSAS